MTDLKSVLAAAMLMAAPAHAQDTTEVAPEPFFRVKTTVPDAVGTADGSRAALELNYFVDRSGEISQLTLFAPGSDAAGLSSACRPQCFKTNDRPPRTFCLIAVGCGGQGGGSTLFQAPVLVEFQPKPDDAAKAEGRFAYDVSVYDFGPDPASNEVTSEFVLPTPP